MVAGFLIDEIGTKAVKPGDEQHASHWWGYPNGPYPPGPPFNLGQGCCSTSIGRVLDFTCQECKPENTALGATWAAGNAINYYQNMNAFVMPDNKWVCYEHHLKYNDPGVANGFIEMFVTNMTDGLPTVQTMGHYNKEWRGARTTDPLPSTAKWALFREYVQDGKGTLYRDGHTVSTTRVGCGTAPPLDTTAPAKPTGLSVQ